jgi:hypothetical protein
MAGGVNYSRRFYEEVLQNPRTASPLIFPETVFNAPASHLAAFLGSEMISYTLVGDDGTFLQGVALAAQWLTDGKVDACLVIGAEETDWIVADAMKLFRRKTIHGAGAGAILLKKDSGSGAIAELVRHHRFVSIYAKPISSRSGAQNAGASAKLCLERIALLRRTRHRRKCCLERLGWRTTRAQGNSWRGIRGFCRVAVCCSLRKHPASGVHRREHKRGRREPTGGRRAFSGLRRRCAG